MYLIDGKFSHVTNHVKEAVASLSDAPIRFMINTHFHPDHTGGNENLGSDGVVVIAHDNVRKRLKSGFTVEAFKRIVKPASKGTLHVLTFDKELSLYFNGEEARVTHIPNAHTDSDAIVHFRQSNVIHMGDVFLMGFIPLLIYPTAAHLTEI